MSPPSKRLAAVTYPPRAPAPVKDPRHQCGRPDDAAATQSSIAHGSPTTPAFDAIFPPDYKPVIFAYHGYPWLIHRLTYRRATTMTSHVRGYKEEGTTTTPFDMCVLNNLDRFQLAQ
jgi:hypothetical protein